MSASDAAPLPRLGEVFFDVRGNSRSMRLSWYADTDVAVFSIWQGGRCTGTFRLPIADLGRMIEILQRGPQGRSLARERDDRGDYAEGDHRGRDYPDRAYREADYPDDGYPGRRDSADEYWGDEPGYQPDRGAGAADESGYGDERFVPPYVRGQDEPYLDDNTVVAPSGPRGYDPAAYPDERPAPAPRGSHYRDPAWTDGEYYDEPEYR